MTIESLVVSAQKYLPESEFRIFRAQVNEVYLQEQLHALYQGMPLSKEPEQWRLDKISTITKQLASL